MSLAATVTTENVSDGEFLQDDTDEEEEEGEISTTPFPKVELSDISDIELEDNIMGSTVAAEHVSIGTIKSKAGATGDNNVEDMDVEILYMRLRALQSMKEKLDYQEDDEMVEEMEELLHEADQAADQAQAHDPDEAGCMDLLMQQTSVVNGGADDKMSDVVKRLKEAARRGRVATEQENYSPTQSPLRDVAFNDLDIDLINPSSPPEVSDEEGAATATAAAAQVVDMEVVDHTETEAEILFFRQQSQEPLFPASVWEFQPKQIIVKQEVVDPDANLEAFHNAVMSQSSTMAQTFRRKRTRSRGKSQTSSEVAKPADNDKQEKHEHEEEDEKALRAAVLSSMAVKRRKKVEEEEELEENKKKPAKPTSIGPKPTNKAKLTLNEKKKQLEAKKKLLLQKAKAVKDLEILKSELEKWQDKSIKNKAVQLPLTRKHFPNLFMRRIIIPGPHLIGSSSNRQGDKAEFQKNLDSLMKDLRSKSAAAAAVVKKKVVKQAKSKPPPKPVRKYPPVPALSVQKKLLSPADKEKLKRSNISHLPLDKQQEYKKLLTLLAQKEKKKQPTTTTTTTTTVIVTAVDENALKAKEEELIKVRKEMCASLFKLSAEVSQLNEETSKKETAEAFLQKLKRQVAVTQELIQRKNERINKLKSVVRQSRQDIVSNSKAMSTLKKQCKNIGLSLKGLEYQPPQEGMETIRKKLTVINNSAKKASSVQQKASSSDSSSSDSDSSSSCNEDNNVEESSSSLAHLARPSVVLDPQVEFCRFDLQGRCNDDSCPYQHHRPAAPAK